MLVGVSGGKPEAHAGGGVLIVGGRLQRILHGPLALRRAARSSGSTVTDLGDGWLMPGFVDAHAHLELSEVRLAAGGFTDWIGEMLRTRKGLRPEDYARAVGSGARRLLESGTTCVGDIASEPRAARVRRPLRSVVYREVLDAWNPERTAGALSTVARALPRRVGRVEGVSPHAPYTTSSELLGRVREIVRRRPMPVAVHWSESQAEVDWLRSGAGGFAPFFPPSPRKRGLDLLSAAGLLDAGTALVHGNLPERGEPQRLARAGVVLVHCPGTHRFFERDPFPWSRYRTAGVPIALGTDSMASNQALDMRQEMALVRAGSPGFRPEHVYAMGTTVAARALGLGKEVGALRVGYWADITFQRSLPGRAREMLDALTSGRGLVDGVWVGGRRIRAIHGTLTPGGSEA